MQGRAGAGKRLGLDGGRPGPRTKGNKEPLYSCREAGSPAHRLTSPTKRHYSSGKGAGNPTGSLRGEHVLVLLSSRRFLLPFDKIIINNNMKK